MVNVKNKRIKYDHSDVSNVDFQQEYTYWEALSSF